MPRLGASKAGSPLVTHRAGFAICVFCGGMLRPNGLETATRVAGSISCASGIGRFQLGYALVLSARCYAAEVSQTQGPPEDIRRRIAGWRAAELRERQVRRDDPILDPTTALELATELCELAPGLFEAEDPVREREVREARAAWAKLRERLGWPRHVQSQS